MRLMRLMLWTFSHIFCILFKFFHHKSFQRIFAIFDFFKHSVAKYSVRKFVYDIDAMKFFTYFFIIFERLCCLQLNFIIILYGILIYFLAKCTTLFGTQLYTVRVQCTAKHGGAAQQARNSKKVGYKIKCSEAVRIIKKAIFWN